MSLANVIKLSGASSNILNNLLRCSVKYQRRYLTSGCLKKDVTAGTMSDVQKELEKSLGIQKQWTILKESREYLLEHEPKSIEDLPPRSMKDSFASALIPLSTDEELRDKYITFLETVRLGRLMEDMDKFAVFVVRQHVHLPKLDKCIPLPYVFVTVLVDQISFTNIAPQSNADIRLSGHVSWVGRSSVEVVVWLDQKHQGKWQRITHALFLMACRNATNTGSAIINPLKPASDIEKKIYSGGEGRKQRRKQESNDFCKEPSPFEQKIIHDIFISTTDIECQAFNVRNIPPNSVWMEHSTIENHIFSHPEDRNAQNTVFGGYLMRQALELSWTLAHQFNKGRPKLERISDIAFHRPVSVSSLLKMHAHVIYTEANFIEIVVVSETFDSITGEAATSNVFYYTYSASQVVPQIIPNTYYEAMWYLHGRRKFNSAMSLDENKCDDTFDHLPNA